MVELIFRSTCSEKMTQIEWQRFMKHLYYWKIIQFFEQLHIYDVISEL